MKYSVASLRTTRTMVDKSFGKALLIVEVIEEMPVIGINEMFVFVSGTEQPSNVLNTVVFHLQTSFLLLSHHDLGHRLR